MGIWGIFDKQTGKLITSQEQLDLLKGDEKDPEFHCNALGSKFHVGNVILHLDSCDVFMMVFNTQIDHQTTHPTKKITGNGFGGNLNSCVKSSQILKTVAVALKKVSSCRGDLSEEDWQVV